MDFKEAAKLGAFIAKDYAEEIFRLLVNYQDLSASEAASRLKLHIKTVQEFLETMTILGILQKKEVYEKKRPYFRYKLKTERILMDINLNTLIEGDRHKGELKERIKERKNAGARFTTARNFEAISSVIIWTGSGRNRQERRINLTMPQGKFLYHLPFPTASALSVGVIMDRANVHQKYMPEILDIIDLLKEWRVIESHSG